jgi:hypothetical protein
MSEPQLFGNLDGLVDFYKKELDWDTAPEEEKPVLSFRLKEYLCLSLLRQLDEHLPPIPAPAEKDVGPLLVGFMKTMFPDDTKLMQFRWLPDLLRPETRHRFSIGLSSEMAGRLRMLANAALEKSTNEDEIEQLQPMAAGHLPLGLTITK